MARPSVHTIRHLADDPFFIQCGANLLDEDGTQIATITSIDDIALELRETSDPETWSEAVGTADFPVKAIQNDPASGLTSDMIRGKISIGGAEPVPAAGDKYAIVAHCTITFIAGYGGGTAKRDFVRPARIAASLETAAA